MLAKFNIEHTHDEDEVRYIIAGRGYSIFTRAGPVVAIEVEAGDLIRVPRGTLHWFDLCGDRTFGPLGCSRTSPAGHRIIRAAAWTGITNPFAGAEYIPPQTAAK